MAVKSVTGTSDDILYGTPKWGRRFVYRPASLWLGWTFIAAILGLVGLIVLLYRIWDSLRPSQSYLLSLAPYVLVVLIPLTFFLGYAGLMYQVSRGFFCVLGDASIYHVAQLTPLGVLITKDEFDAADDPDLSTMPDYTGKTVVRHKVNLWGRLGGVWGWPGWSGGKSDGYYNVVYDYWDEVENKPLSIAKPCPTCAGTGKVETRGHHYTPSEIDALKNVVPGMRMGTTMVLPYEAWPIGLDEIHEEICLAIRSDPEYRVSSRVWNMEDLLPSKVSMGSTVPSNTLVTSWANERRNRWLRDYVMELKMQMAMMEQLGAGGLSIPPPLGGMGLGGTRPGP